MGKKGDQSFTWERKEIPSVQMEVNAKILDILTIVKRYFTYFFVIAT